jgi:hypothetical protein
MKRHLKIVKKINQAIAMKSTLLVGSMGCVYAFLIWSLLPTFFPGLQNFVFYVSGGVIQLVLLPLIMVGGSVLNTKSERRAEADHKMLMEELKELRAMHAELHELITGTKS